MQLAPPEREGFLKIRHPALYIFPGGFGDSTFFTVNGCNILINGGALTRWNLFFFFSRKTRPAAWACQLRPQRKVWASFWYWCFFPLVRLFTHRRLTTNISCFFFRVIQPTTNTCENSHNFHILYACSYAIQGHCLYTDFNVPFPSGQVGLIL